MKVLLLISCILLSGCAETSFAWGHDGKPFLFKSFHGQLSIYGTSVCFPWKEKIIVCSSAAYDGDIDGSVVIKYIPEKKVP
jgi:lysophospholipid acyltransferase (LPLAT)-like uncharacterized protein